MAIQAGDVDEHQEIEIQPVELENDGDPFPPDTLVNFVRDKATNSSKKQQKDERGNKQCPTNYTRSGISAKCE